ncbi:MAG: hypothetical protein GY754_28880, partial [bacterium]|nr:hypothetical protein [bacterium]
MKNLFKVLSVFFLCTFIFACGSDPQDKYAPGTGGDSASYASIKGKVRIDGLDDLSGITVTAEQVIDGNTVTVNSILKKDSVNLESLVFKTETDPEGNFLFSEIPEGEYLITASKDNTAGAISKNVEAAASQIAMVTMSLEGTGSLSGLVTLNGLSSGLTGTLVYAEGTNYVAAAADDGSFAIDNIPAGTYDIIYYNRDCAYVETAAVTVTESIETVLDTVNLTAFGSGETPGPGSPPVVINASDGVSEDNIVVRWNAVQDAAYYFVYRDTAEAGNFTELVGYTSTIVLNDAAARAGVRYYYRVESYFADGSVSGLSTNVDSGFKKLAHPEGISAADGEELNRIKISWDRVEGAEYYNIYRETSAAGDFTTLIGSPHGTSFYDDTADYGTAYYYKVRAYSSIVGESDLSDFDAGHEKLHVPTELKASDKEFNHVKIDWNPVQGADSYYVYREEADSFSGFFHNIIGTASSNTYTDSTTTGGVKYYYCVKAHSSYFGDSEFSAYDVGYKIIDAPANVSAADGMYLDSIQVTWDNVDGANEYAIYRSSTGPEGTYAYRGKTASLQYNDISSSNGSTFYYKVEARSLDSEYGTSELSDCDSGYEMLMYPLDVAVSKAELEDVRISWSAVTSSEIYYIYRSLSPDESSFITLLDSTTDTEYFDTTVDPYTDYYYRVRSYSSLYGESPFSNYDYGYSNFLDIPTGPTASDGDSESITITWNAVGEADRYYVYRSDAEAGSYSKIAESAAVTYSDSSGNNASVYFYQISAFSDKYGESEQSASDSGYEKLLAPQDVTASKAESESVKTTWTAVTGAETYYVYRSLSPDENTFTTVLGTTTNTEYDDTTVNPYTDYYYRVKSHSPVFGESLLSDSDYGYSNFLDVPSGAAASDGNPDSITITWNSVGEADLYYVYRSNSESGTYAKIGEAAGLTYADASGDSGYFYFYKIAAFSNKYGESEQSVSDSGYEMLLPPEDVSVSKAESVDVRITWTAVTGANSYSIYRSLLSDEGTFITVLDSTADTEYYDTTVDPYTDYYYRVVAHSADFGDSLFSGFDFGYSNFIDVPTSLNARDGSYSSNIYLSWDSVSQADGYYIYKSSKPDGVYGKIADRPGVGYSDYDAHVNLKSYYKITSYSAKYGESAMSAYDSGYRSISLVQNVSASDGAYDEVNGDSVIISWDAQPSVNSYSVYRKTGDQDMALVETTSNTEIIDGTAENTGTLYTYYVIFHTEDLGDSGFGSGDDGYKLPISGTWTEKNGELSTGRDEFATAVVNGKIYAIGGDGRIDIVEEYDPAADTWTVKTPMPTAREELAAEAVNGKIYAIGGYSSSGYSNVVEEYDPSTDTWTTKTSMPTERDDLATAVVDGKIYAIGGWAGLYDVEEYDPATDTWTVKASLSPYRSEATASVVNGKIYLIGGNYNPNRVDEYDPATDSWTEKASMPTGREELSSVAVNGKIYVMGGYDGSNRVNTVEEYDPVNDNWTTKLSLLQVRREFSSEVINNKIYAIGGYGASGNLASVEECTISGTAGFMPSSSVDAAGIAANDKIYVMGGYNGSSYLNRLEEYDKSADTWTVKSSMSTARSGLTAGEINGKIYAVGGFDGTNHLTVIEEYDPAADSWTVKTTMPTARSGHACAISNNKIYIMGGYDGTYLDVVEVYDPDLDSWTSLSIMPVSRSGLTAAEVDGNIYLFGGHDGSGHLSRIDQYDPSTDTWTELGNMTYAASGIKSVIGSDSRIYLFGGYNDSGFLNSVRAYDPADYYSWASITDLSNARAYHTAVVLDTEIYLFSGLSDTGFLHNAEVYTVAEDYYDRYAAVADMRFDREDLTAEAVNGKIYAIGGYDRSSSARISTVEEYDPVNDTWLWKASMPTGREMLASASLNGKIYVLGGRTNNTYYSTAVEEYDPDTNSWTTKTSMSTGRYGLVAEAVNGRIYAIGGYNGSYLSTVREYNPATNLWSTNKSPMPTARRQSASAVIDGKIYVIGGYNSSYLSTVQEYDPGTNSWTTKASMPTARYDASAEIVNGKIYVIGGYGSDGYLKTVEEYDPETNSWTTKTPILYSRISFGSAVLNDEIYVIGGYYDL